MIIEDWEQLKNKIDELKKTGKKIVFTNGCFDILHWGHVSYLKKAKELGDYLVLALNTDQSVQKLKGPTRPINKQHDRALVINELKSIDFVTFFSEETPFNIINLIKPDIIAKGGDYNPNQVVGKDIVESYGGYVAIIPFVDGKSTTNIINKIVDK
jgi:D-beta-D-heptose 7-phosphate kinase/D-beta-D-heptose 1-phosphate adenosyltransferase